MYVVYLLCFSTFDIAPILLISISIMWLDITSILLTNLIFSLVLNSFFYSVLSRPLQMLVVFTIAITIACVALLDDYEGRLVILNKFNQPWFLRSSARFHSVLGCKHISFSAWLSFVLSFLS